MTEFCYVRLTTIFVQEEDGRWTAECKELGTATFGDTFEEAKKDLDEAIELHLNTLTEVGEIERFFRENGITIGTFSTTKSVRKSIPVAPNVFMNSHEYPIQACPV